MYSYEKTAGIFNFCSCFSLRFIHKSAFISHFFSFISCNSKEKGSKSRNVNMKNVNVIPPISETPAIASYFSFHEFIIRLKHFHFISFPFLSSSSIISFILHALCTFLFTLKPKFKLIHRKIECEFDKNKKNGEKSALEHMLNLFNEKNATRSARSRSECFRNILWHEILNGAFHIRLFSTEEESTDLYSYTDCVHLFFDHK